MTDEPRFYRVAVEDVDILRGIIVFIIDHLDRTEVSVKQFQHLSQAQDASADFLARRTLVREVLGRLRSVETRSVEEGGIAPEVCE